MAKTSENYISKEEVDKIDADLKKIFSTEGAAQITSIDIDSLKEQIINILDNMKLEEKKSDKNATYYIWNGEATQKYLALEGYKIIMKCRQYLLDESIRYVYYWDVVDNEGNHSSGIETYEEATLSDHIKYGQTGLLLREITSKKRIGKYEELDLYKTAHYNKLMAGFKLDNNGEGPVNDYFRTFKKSYYAPRMAIYEHYNKENPGLINQQKKDRQWFNKGHIFEAVDTSVEYANFKGTKPDHFATIKNYVFGKFLVYDSIIASQGGDNPFTNASVKSGAAGLYDYSTIKTQLNKILELFNNLDYSAMKQNIIELFLNKEKFRYNNKGRILSDSTAIKAMEQKADQAVNKMLELLKSSSITKSSF